MCGIIGYVGKKDCQDFLFQGLKRLEYRGYDSAGIAVYDSSKKNFKIHKSEGKLNNLGVILEKNRLNGHTGLAHTRWATHGKPNSINAHPHRAGSTVLVHNGIIENYEELKKELKGQGAKLVSETDSELFGHLVESLMQQGNGFMEAVRLSFLRLRGSCTIVVGHDSEPATLIAIRNGTPLVAAFSDTAQGAFVASDVQALLEHTHSVTYLENEDLVLLRENEFRIYSLKEPIEKQKPVQRESTHIDWKPSAMEKEGFDHFMLKEIFEQPRAVLDTLDTFEQGELEFPDLEKLFQGVRAIHMVACGTAWHAALVGRYILESSARIPVLVDLASEYRYRDPIVDEHTLIIAISQSGETADTLAALREAKSRGAKSLVICNVRGSTMTREADVALFTAAGPEIGVASTKAFVTQLVMMMFLGHSLEAFSSGSATGQNSIYNRSFFARLPHSIEKVLGLRKQIQNIAKRHVNSRGFLFVGRGILFPIALEGALKLKEISYVHAEGYPAGELKHGPIAMVDPEMSVVVLIPKDELYEKNLSNLQEVRARGGRMIGLGAEDDEVVAGLCEEFIGLPFHGDGSDAILATLPLQLLAYEMAILKGTDVDKPRNLAKSVTVE